MWRLKLAKIEEVANENSGRVFRVDVLWPGFFVTSVRIFLLNFQYLISYVMDYTRLFHGLE